MSDSPAPASGAAPSKAARIGFWLGLIGGVLVIALAGVVPRPGGLSVPAIRTVGVTIIVGVW